MIFPIQVYGPSDYICGLADRWDVSFADSVAIKFSNNLIILKDFQINEKC